MEILVDTAAGTACAQHCSLSLASLTNLNIQCKSAPGSKERVTLYWGFPPPPHVLRGFLTPSFACSGAPVCFSGLTDPWLMSTATGTWGL